MAAIPQEFALSPALQTEHQNFSQLLEMEHTAIVNNKSLLQTDSMQVLNLIALELGSEGLMKVYARNLLYGIQGATDYSEPYQMPQSGLKDTRIRWVKGSSNTSNSLKLYPNPARNYVIAEYFLKEHSTNCVLTFYNNTGVVFKELPVSVTHGYARFMVDDLPSGLYLCKLVCGLETLDAVKLIITK
jgi:hypothetical protein